MSVENSRRCKCSVFRLPVEPNQLLIVQPIGTSHVKASQISVKLAVTALPVCTHKYVPVSWIDLLH